MFLQYAPAGAVIPLYSLRLQELGFSPVEIGWGCATQALAGLVAPIAAGQVADRWFAAERCLAIYAAVAGGLLWLLAELTSPLAVIATSLAFWLTMVPAISLGTSLSFTHLVFPERDFGRVRMWGTVGWVVTSLLLGYWFHDPAWLHGLATWLRPEKPASKLGDAFRLGSLLAFFLASYSLTLPHTPPRHRAGSWLAPLTALRLLRGRTFAVYCFCSLGVCATLPFGTQVNPLFLEYLGIPRAWLSPTLTIGQSTEVASLAVLPMILLRLGFRGTMLLGLAALVLAQAVLFLGYPTWFVVGSLALNGLCICCFLVAGQVFVNSRARGDIRASSQSLLTCTNSLGMLIGNVLAGWVRRIVDGDFPSTYAVGASCAVLLTLAFFIGFAEDMQQ